MKYQRIIRAVRESVWAIHPKRLADILDVLEFKAGGGELSRDEIRAYMELEAAARPARSQAANGVAVIGVRGIISHRIEEVDDISGPGGTSAERLTQRIIAAANDDSVQAIVLDIDSPGGTVNGVPEAADMIRGARAQKPILAVANSLAASAAYWLASAADELSITPSGEVGSIGVFAAHSDISAALEMLGEKVTLIHAGKYKVEGNPFEPLSTEARDEIQRRVDQVHGDFIGAVAKHRGTTAAAVKADYGQGRVYGAKEARQRGMVDRIETLDEAIARARAGKIKSREARAPRRAARSMHEFMFA